MSWLNPLLEKQSIQKKANLEKEIPNIQIPQNLSKQDCIQKIADLNLQIDEMENSIDFIDIEKNNSQKESYIYDSCKNESIDILSNLKIEKLAYENVLQKLSFSFEDSLKKSINSYLGDTITSIIPPKSITLSNDDIEFIQEILASKGIKRNKDIIKVYAKQLDYNLQDNDIDKSAADPSLKAPKEWWDKMEKEVKQGNPSYSQDQVDKTIGSIWSDLSDSKKSEIRGRYGKEYGPAKSKKKKAIDQNKDVNAISTSPEKEVEELGKLTKEEISEYLSQQEVEDLGSDYSKFLKQYANKVIAVTEEEIQQKANEYVELQRKLTDFNLKIEELKDQLNYYATEERSGLLFSEIEEAMKDLNIDQKKVKNILFKIKERSGYIKAKESEFTKLALSLLEKYMPIVANVKNTLLRIKKLIKPEEKEKIYEEVERQIGETPELEKYITRVKPTRKLEVKPASNNIEIEKFADNFFKKIYNWFIKLIFPNIDKLSQGIDELESLAQKENII